MDTPTGREKGLRRRSWPLHVYLVALVAVAVIVAGAGGLYGGIQATRDAKHAAQQDATFWARLASKDLSEETARLRDTVAATAANPAVGQVYGALDQCSLSFAWAGLMGGGHLDLLAQDGSVVCSSLPEAVGPGYVGADWLRQADAGPAFVGPITDPATGKMVELAFAAVPGHGFVAAAVELGPLGTSLSTNFNHPAGLEFLVTTADGSTALGRSVRPARWVAAPLGDTAFARSTNRSERPDVDGTVRYYDQATAQPIGWRVYAGVDRAGALGAAYQHVRWELLIILVGLAIICAGAFLIYRRITTPILRLGRAVRSATDHQAPAEVSISGPSEVVELAETFNGLIAAVDRELGERQRAEEALRVSEQSYRLLFEGNPRPMWLYDPATLSILEVNSAAVDHYGYSREAFRGMMTADLEPPPEPDGGPPPPGDGRASRSGPTRHVRKDGSVIDVEVAQGAVAFGGKDAQLVMAEDVTDKRLLEGRLRQAERMESLGQLAGGIAHDFNNIMTAVSGFADFVGEEVREAERGDPKRWGEVHRDVVQIQAAAERASGLTRQLLAFARREVAQPIPLDLNEVVAEVEPLLRRTLGEHVELMTDLMPSLAPVMADRGQMGQVLVNLAVNARDAMPAGGILRIDTNDVLVDQTYVASSPRLKPGPYVQLRVSDTGLGMSREVMDRAFEPFFTTKAPGEGTGLGLATVFGIVTQAGGDILIYSEPGMGTSFRALFPATSQTTALADATVERHRKVGGETILVVEDEEAIREVATRILTRSGYSVIAAASGREAMSVIERHQGAIDLLLTDMFMPQMQGSELAGQVSTLRPGIRVLFMSGYTQLHLDEGAEPEQAGWSMEKPFTAPTLLARVRQVLDS